MARRLLSYNRGYMRFRPGDRWALGFKVAAFAFSTHAFAAASGPPLSVGLHYEVDPQLDDCPSAAALSAAVSQQLGYDPFVAETGPTKHVRVSIQRTAGGTEAHVEWLNERGASEGERRLSSESAACEEIARGLSFAIAVQIQLRASAEPPPTPRAAPAPASPPPPPSVPPLRRRRPAESRRVIMLGAGVLAARGLTPQVSPGLRIFGSLGNERLSLELSTQATLPSEQSAEATVPHLSRLAPRPSFTASELSAKLAPCLRLRPFGVCGVFMAGQLHVRGQGVDQLRSPSSLVAASGAKLQLLWPPVPSLGVLLQAEALALLTPRDVLMNRRIVWSTSPVLLGVSLDLAVIFR